MEVTMENKIDMGEKLDSIGRKILAAARNELYLKMRFLSLIHI